MTTQKTWALTAVFAISGLTTIHAEGFEANDSVFDNVTLKNVSIVGTKVNKHNLTPSSVSTVGSYQIQTNQIGNIEDLSSQLPNIFIPEYGSRQTTPIIMRGIYSKVKGTAVGYYVDGMPHFELSAFNTDMLDVKAIEVFRGPQGTLYGRNTIGGVINVYNYTPFDYQGTKVRLRYGNYNTVKAQASHYALLNEQLGLNLSGYYEHSDGYFKNITLGKKADKLNAGGGRVALHYKPTEKWMMRLSSSLDYLNQGGYAYSVYKPEIDSLGDISYNRPSGYKRLISGTGFTANYTSDKWSLNSQTSFQYIRDDQEVDQDFTAKDTYFVTNGIRHNVISEEVTLKSEHENKFQWVVGTFLFSQWGTQDQGTDYLTKGYEQRSLYDTSLRGAALFAQGSYNLVGGLSATIGLRLDHEYNSMDYARTQLNHEDNTKQPVGEPFVESLKFTELIPRFGLQYAFGKRNMVFGNITKGYKGGGFNATIPTDEDRTYDSEYNWNYEIGTKLASEDGNFSAEATFFYIDWKNQHVNQTVPGLGNVVSNAGHSNSKGVELSINYRPTTALTIQANYGYTYAKFLDYKKSETVDYSGNIVPMVPRNTFALNANYCIREVGALDAITISAGVNGVGKLYWLEDNAVCQHMYVLPSARIEMKKGVFCLAFWGKNLSNTKYHSYYFVSSAKYAQKGTPITVGTELTINF